MKYGHMTIVAALALSGCAGANYAMQNYSGVSPITWTGTQTKNTYRIFDKPAEKRLMITLGFGESMAQGFGQGLTLGVVSTATPSVVYQDAALEWLKTTGRICKATAVSLVLEPQYEVRYECEAPAAPQTTEAK